MKNKAKKLILILIYFLSPLIVIILFYSLNPSELNYPPVRQLAYILGITAFVWLNYEFVLTSRIKFIDRIFGMDRVILFHIIMSGVSFQLALVHGIIMFNIGENNLIQIASGINILTQYIILMIIGAIFLHGAGVKIKKMKYNVAKNIHNLTIITTSFMLLHAALSNPVHESPMLLIIFVLFYLLAILSWLNLKVFRIIKVKNNPYEVTEIIKETKAYWTLNLKSKNGKPMEFKPGQYSYLSFISQEISKEFHPFSFASSPAEKNIIRFTIKELGDYTRCIGKVKVGEIAYIEGPYGIFDALNSTAQELVFIAGGSGITPFLSMLRYMKDTNNTRKATLIWGIRYPHELFLKDEFEEMKKTNPNLVIIPVVSDDDNWEGECGFIDRDRLERLVPCEDPNELIQKKDYYVCGPPLMVKIVRPALKSMGINKNKRIHIEKFYR